MRPQTDTVGREGSGVPHPAAAKAEQTMYNTTTAAAMAAGPITTSTVTGAELVVRAASAAGLRVCFSNPGTTEMWVVAALDATWPAVRPVLVLQEGVAAGAADGYYRISRSPAMALLHLGPGLANASAALHNARRAASPVLALVGDMATWHVSYDPLLAAPIARLAGCVSRHVVVCGGAGEGHGAQGGAEAGGRSGADGGGGIRAADDSEQGAVARGVVEALSALAEEAAAGAGGGGGGDGCGGSGGQGDGLEPVRDGRVVTLVLPHDLSWQQLPAEQAAAVVRQVQQVTAPASAPPPAPDTSAGVPTGPGGTAAAAAAAAVEAFLRDCAAALKSAGRGNAALYLGGTALLAVGGGGGGGGGPLQAAGLVAAAAGAVVLCENAFARADRGAGRPALRRLPYFPQEAAAELSKYKVLVLVDARPPVANFGYDGGPSRLVCQAPDAVWELLPCELAQAGWSLDGALTRLASELGAAFSTATPPAATAAAAAAGRAVEHCGGQGGASVRVVTPLANCGGVFAPPRRPPLPPLGSRLTAAALCAVVAALQPEGCVVVDESLTAGSTYWEASQGCPPFTHLTLTGGAIGSGPPMALGAAVALAEAEADADAQGSQGPPRPPGAPEAGARRRVINLQADGSAMYSLQALWSIAREQLPVTTIICANSAYAILKVEAARQRVHTNARQAPATRALTELSPPAIDWVALAGGMGVPAARVDTAGGLAEQLAAALAMPGPFLIQANI